jgi:hypothetical protein
LQIGSDDGSRFAEFWNGEHHPGNLPEGVGGTAEFRQAKRPHERLHFVQTCTFGFMYTLAIDLFSAALGLLSPSTNRTFLQPQELPAEARTQVQAIDQRLADVSDDDLTALDIIESVTYYHQLSIRYDLSAENTWNCLTTPANATRFRTSSMPFRHHTSTALRMTLRCDIAGRMHSSYSRAPPGFPCALNDRNGRSFLFASKFAPSIARRLRA